MGQQYINIALSRSNNNKAEACWRIHETAASKEINTRTLLNDPAVSTKAVTNRQQPSKAYMTQLYMNVALSLHQRGD